MRQNKSKIFYNKIDLLPILWYTYKDRFVTGKVIA